MFIQTKCNELSFADLIRATKDTIDESKKFPYKTFVTLPLLIILLYGRKSESRIVFLYRASQSLFPQHRR